MCTTSLSAAEFVSPIVYKDLSCDEMKQEWSDLREQSLDAFSDSVEKTGRLAKEATELHEKIEAQRKALDKAMERADCKV